MIELPQPSEPAKPVFPLTQREVEIIGYVHAWGCTLQDQGLDPRKAYCDDLLAEVRDVFQHRSAVKPDRDAPLIICCIFAFMMGLMAAGALWIASWAPYVR